MIALGSGFWQTNWEDILSVIGIVVAIIAAWKAKNAAARAREAAESMRNVILP